MFFNGHEDFKKELTEGQLASEESEFEMLKNMLKAMRATRNWEDNLGELVGHFLERRRMYMDKYQESSLQKMYVSLRNDRK